MQSDSGQVCGDNECPFGGLSTPTLWEVQSDSGQVCGDEECPFSGLSTPNLWKVQSVDRCVEIKECPFNGVTNYGRLWSTGVEKPGLECV